MRVIAGNLKGRRLEAPADADLRVRPTSDRAREALFSILQRWPQGAFLDLFSGTGAVALEAFSRGYDPVTAVEQGEPGWSCIQRNLHGTGVKALRSDALSLKAEAFRRQAVIFADPPYAEASPAWEALAARLRGWLEPGGVLIWETESTLDLPPAPGWRLEAIRDYGRVRFHILHLEE
ncbi:MAG TPA: RsmD family RNA methyltransferase [Holophagaceae bacterium]|nr:RsmD family RNA methyltransferase [Holophagaceae bacterium]